MVFIQQQKYKYYSLTNN